MNADWREAARRIAKALRGARALSIFGLCGMTLEDQHRAFGLARALGAFVSVERPLLPTLTRGSLARHRLALVAGGEPDFPLPEGMGGLRDDRLLTADAWRNLRILQRGRTSAEAEGYRALYDTILSAGGAAFLFCADRADDALRIELAAFRAECGVPRGLDYIQLTDVVNLLGAYETALEEAGGAHAAFAGGSEKAEDAYALGELLRQNAIDAALLVGQSAEGAHAVLSAGVPLYAIGRDTPGAELCVTTAPLGAEEGGTILRDDGVPLAVPTVEKGGLSALGEVLSFLMSEVGGC
ncbi:MAG TPA: hypothetical protein VN540_07785 [Clostridia bacterium]|nr:hypothetical protein [Clostridia bacterium]